VRELPLVFRALRHRNFRLFIAGQQISLIGTWMQSVAQQWLVYRLTGSATILGLIGFASQIPSFVMGPVGGMAADRANRHRLIILTQVSFMLLAFVLAWLTLSGRVQIWHIFVLAALGGVVNAFDVPGRQAFIVQMTSKEDLMNAIGLNSSMFNASRVIGPAVAGILVAWLGEGWCFFVNAFSFLAVLLGLMLMRVEAPPPRRADRSAWVEMLEGLRFVNEQAPIKALMMLTAVCSLLGTFSMVLMPIFAAQILGGGARELGILMGATGLGALMGALTLASRKTVQGLGRWLGAAAAAFGILVALFAVSRTLWLSVVLLVPVGFTTMLQMAATNTLIQVMVPDDLRGRAMSVYSMMFMGMMPFGSLLAGKLAEFWGAPLTVAAGGIGCTVAGVIFLVSLPRLRPQTQFLIDQASQT
jgi:MFS family permease